MHQQGETSCCLPCPRDRGTTRPFIISIILCVLVGIMGGPVALANTVDVREQIRELSPYEQDEVVWLARCVISESNRRHEQKLVAWTVRNRVETSYRGETYREVVLEPLQFSAFNTPSPRRSYILSLDLDAHDAAWLEALQISLEVYQAPAEERPFPQETRHFYSPISMKGNKTPPWAVRATPLPAASLDIDDNRFRFYTDIDESLDPFMKLDPQVTPAMHIEEKKKTMRRRPRSRLTPTGRVARPVRPSQIKRN